MSATPGPLSSKDAWELVASGYAELADWVMRPFSARASELLPLQLSSRVVDVAAGPGTLTLEVAPRVTTVDAVDFSPLMVAELEQRARALGIQNVRTWVADGQALPLPDSQFDLGFSLFGLMFFPDRPRGYRELLRVLAPGGHALISSWASIERSPLMALLFGAIRAMDPGAPAPRYDPASLENPDVLAAEMAAAGFRQVEVEGCTRSILLPSPAQLWEDMVRSSAPLALLRRRLGEEWAHKSQIAREYLETHAPPAGAQLSTTAWLAHGIK